MDRDLAPRRLEPTTRQLLPAPELIRVANASKFNNIGLDVLAGVPPTSLGGVRRDQESIEAKMDQAGTQAPRRAEGRSRGYQSGRCQRGDVVNLRGRLQPLKSVTMTT